MEVQSSPANILFNNDLLSNDHSIICFGLLLLLVAEGAHVHTADVHLRTDGHLTVNRIFHIR